MLNGIIPVILGWWRNGICEQYIQPEAIVEAPKIFSSMQIPKGSKRNKKRKVKLGQWKRHKKSSGKVEATHSEKGRESTDRSFLGLSGCIWIMDTCSTPLHIWMMVMSSLILHFLLIFFLIPSPIFYLYLS